MDAQDVIFVTDIHEEALAAEAAGMRVLLAFRPGNKVIEHDHGWKFVDKFDKN